MKEKDNRNDHSARLLPPLSFIFTLFYAIKNSEMRNTISELVEINSELVFPKSHLIFPNSQLVLTMNNWDEIVVDI